MIIMEFGEEKHEKIAKVMKCIHEKMELLQDLFDEEEYPSRYKDHEYRRGRYY